MCQFCVRYIGFLLYMGNFCVFTVSIDPLNLFTPTLKITSCNLFTSGFKAYIQCQCFYSWTALVCTCFMKILFAKEIRYTVCYSNIYIYKCKKVKQLEVDNCLIFYISYWKNNQFISYIFGKSAQHYILQSTN